MQHTYTQHEVLGILLNLVNGIGQVVLGDIMPKRYKEQIELNGEKRWITGKSIKELLEAYLTICIDSGIVAPILSPGLRQISPQTVLYGEYLKDFVEAYKSNQESLTKVNRDRIIRNHIQPTWGNIAIADIKPADLQKWFNKLAADGYSHETLLKIKNTMSPAFDAAVEDGLIPRNPLKSRLLNIAGTETESHKAIPNEKMQQIRTSIPTITAVNLKNMAGLLCYTGMRFEEILGLRWEDIDFDGKWIMIQRAVIHPTRNQPEVKDPKTKTSKRRIPLAKDLENILKPCELTGYILPSSKDSARETPLSYTESRRLFQKIKDLYGLQGFSAHDFRDTCATEWREKGIPLDVISSLLGHSKVDVTQKRYVKYRDEIFQGVRGILDTPNGTENGQNNQG